MPDGKICIKCGLDVAALPRTKDNQGKYWCKNCYKAAVAARKGESKPAPASPAAAEDDLTAALLEEATVYQQNVCENCRSPMAEGAVICVNCGFNANSGRQSQTKVKKESEAAAKAIGAASMLASSWPMAILFAVIGGTVGGGVGAGIWAAVAYNLDFEIGWIAWAVGGLVGTGVVIGARGYTGIFTGLIAVAIAVAAVAGGRMWAISMIADDLISQIDFEDFEQVDRGEIISYLATDVADEWEASGERLRWPAGSDNYSAWYEEDFPADVWAEAETRWNVWDEGERNRYVAAKEAEMQQASQDLQGLSGAGLMDIYMETLSPIDFLFFGLAVLTAAAVGSGGELSMGGE